MASRDHVSARVILEPARTVPSSANLPLPQSSAARLKMRSKLSETYAYVNPLPKWLFLGHLVENIAGRVSLPAFKQDTAGHNQRRLLAKLRQSVRRVDPEG